MDSDLLNKAYLFAETKHKGQLYGDKPFIYHLLQTYEIITLLQPEDETLRACAFLHDVCEDTKTTKKELENEFGKEIAELVYEVTKKGYNFFPNLKSKRAVILLFASRLANLVNMKDWSEERQATYIKKSRFWLS